MSTKRIFTYTAKDFENLSVGGAVNNVVSVYDKIPQTTRDKFRLWYPIALDTCREIARRHGLTVAQVVGVVAVTSPNLRWDKNVLTAVRIILHWKRLGVFFVRDVGFMAYPRNVWKALRILQGEAPEDVVSGDKVSAFFHNILACDSDSVTIDRHALNVLFNGVNGKKSGNLAVTSEAYALCVAVYKAATQYVNVRDGVELTPSQLQAITWAFYAAKGEI